MTPFSGEFQNASGIAPEFIIGITGHRDIAGSDLESVRSSLRKTLKTVSEKFQHVPVRIATGLAEGADTIAAEVAMELGIGVLAVLPMPVDCYREDFSGAALDRFESLLADTRVNVTEIALACNRGPADMGDPENRDEQYRLLADFLTRRSNLLVAIWDGRDTGLVGGTSDVVMRYLCDGRDQLPYRISRDDSAAEGCGNTLVWIGTNRVSLPADELPDGPCYLVSNANYDCYWRSRDIPKRILTRWAGFDSFYAERASSRGEELPGYGLGDASNDALSHDLKNLDVEFVRADQIARYYQSQSHFMFALFALLAAGMGLVFLIYAKLLADKTLLVVYIGLFLAGFMCFRLTHRRHVHSKHLAYRALAETFRVQFFLIQSGAGVDYNPRRMIGMTSVDQFLGFEWLLEAIRIGEPLVYFGHCKNGNALKIVQDRWVKDQLGYFEKKQHHLHRQHHRLETIKFALLVGSVIGALSLIFFKKALIHLDMMGYDGKAWLVFFMGLLPLWAAVWELYQGKMATRELLWQYANQSRYFRAANVEIEQAPSLEEGQKIIRDLADKALIEIYMWSVHRFHREHEPPAAG